MYQSSYIQIFILASAINAQNCSLVNLLREGSIQTAMLLREPTETFQIEPILLRNFKSSSSDFEIFGDMLEFELIKMGKKTFRRPDQTKQSKEEIQKKTDENKFDFIIRTVISKYEYGPLLEGEKSSHIFITLHSPENHIIGAITHTATGRDLEDLNFLSSTSKKICSKISEIILHTK